MIPMVPDPRPRKVVLTRIHQEDTRTLGVAHVYDGTVEIGRFCILELPDRNNARNISRIPAGRYRMTPETSPKFRDYFRIHDVPGRSGILVHRGNLPSHTQGCLLIGLRFTDLDGDGLFDVSQSDAAMRLFSGMVTGEADLFVVDAC